MVHTQIEHGKTGNTTIVLKLNWPIARNIHDTRLVLVVFIATRVLLALRLHVNKQRGRIAGLVTQ